METSDVPLLSKFDLTSSEAERIWSALPSRFRESIELNFVLLHSKSLLDNDVAILLMRNPYYSLCLTQLLIQLHTMGMTLSDHLTSLSSKAYIAHHHEALFKKMVAWGCVMDTDRVNAVLSVWEVDAFDSLLEFWHVRKMLNQDRLDSVLQKKASSISGYVNCLKVLFSSYLNSLADEEILLNIADEHINDVGFSLRLLDSGSVLSRELWLALVEHQHDAKSITEGLEVLTSRVESPEPLPVLTVIRAADVAESVAGSVSFLIKCGLASDENCAALVRTKAYSKPIEILLFQLTRQSGATPENIHSLIQVAPILMEPILMDRLKRISFFSPMPVSHINELLRLLSTLSTETLETLETLETDKTEVLTRCARLIDPAFTVSHGELKPDESGAVEGSMSSVSREVTLLQTASVSAVTLDVVESPQDLIAALDSLGKIIWQEPGEGAAEYKVAGEILLQRTDNIKKHMEEIIAYFTAHPDAAVDVEKCQKSLDALQKAEDAQRMSVSTRVLTAAQGPAFLDGAIIEEAGLVSSRDSSQFRSYT